MNAETDAIIHLHQGKKKTKNCQRPKLFSINDHFIWTPDRRSLWIATMPKRRSGHEISHFRAISPAFEQFAAIGQQRRAPADPVEAAWNGATTILVHCTRIS